MCNFEEIIEDGGCAHHGHLIMVPRGSARPSVTILRAPIWGGGNGIAQIVSQHAEKQIARFIDRRGVLVNRLRQRLVDRFIKTRNILRIGLENILIGGRSEFDHACPQCPVFRHHLVDVETIRQA
jgi:hypothetical protein